MNKKVIFAGTPIFSTNALTALIDSGYDVIAVYTQPDRRSGRGKNLTKSPVKVLAETHNIPLFQPESLRDEAAQKAFIALNADIMIVVAYGLLLPIGILNAPKFGCINIHASLLPKWRGAAPIHRAIEAGDDQSGVCIMQMDQGLDTGAVWHKGAIAITENMTTGALHDELQILGARLLLEALPKIFAGKEQPKTQSDRGITYAKKIEKAESKIDWSEDARTIMRKIHAFNPAPGAFSMLEDVIIKLWHCTLTDQKSLEAKGTLIIENDQLYVVTGDGFLLELLVVQSAGKKAMNASDYLKGHDLHHKVFS